MASTFQNLPDPIERPQNPFGRIYRSNTSAKCSEPNRERYRDQRALYIATRCRCNSSTARCRCNIVVTRCRCDEFSETPGLSQPTTSNTMDHGSAPLEHSIRNGMTGPSPPNRSSSNADRPRQHIQAPIASSSSLPLTSPALSRTIRPSHSSTPFPPSDVGTEDSEMASFHKASSRFPRDLTSPISSPRTGEQNPVPPFSEFRRKLGLVPVSTSHLHIPQLEFRSAVKTVNVRDKQLVITQPEKLPPDSLTAGSSRHILRSGARPRSENGDISPPPTQRDHALSNPLDPSTRSSIEYFFIGPNGERIRAGPKDDLLRETP
ncbi:hypothetical protein EJ04DRAFT_550510 [Polyplosphaeria fusca]|uniref:Uncharacterized protein n=1 Tax=Polyplosphaeria fusca TaxID=682080 RepID=A0A9P4R6F8_9PLEO|nr:hypothetical protein EJ04DRAFT_550510 [Polyplosphaeria fusca]